MYFEDIEIGKTFSLTEEGKKFKKINSDDAEMLDKYGKGFVKVYVGKKIKVVSL